VPVQVQLTAGVAALRGAGAAAEKSAALLFESAQPPSARITDSVALGAGVAPPSKQPVFA
jgi:hypothetical protein